MRFGIPGHLPGLVPEPPSTEKKSSDSDRDRSRSSVPGSRFPVLGSRSGPPGQSALALAVAQREASHVLWRLAGLDARVPVLPAYQLPEIN
jgi:hypothetical protein